MRRPWADRTAPSASVTVRRSSPERSCVRASGEASRRRRATLIKTRRRWILRGRPTTLKESVCFDTISGSDIDLAVGDSWSGKMTDRRQRVAPIGGLIRRIDQIERNRVKGKELTADDPQNSVAVTVGGNE